MVGVMPSLPFAVVDAATTADIAALTTAVGLSEITGPPGRSKRKKEANQSPTWMAVMAVAMAVAAVATTRVASPTCSLCSWR